MTHTELTTLDDLFTPVELPEYTPEDLDVACEGLIDLLSDSGELTTEEYAPVVTMEFSTMHKPSCKTRQYTAKRVKVDSIPATVSKHVKPIYFTPDIISDMRDWLCDCVFQDVTRDDIAEMSDSAIIVKVRKYYDGGIPGFAQSYTW